MGMPRSSRLFLAASELFLSVFGWLVSGSFGSASHDSVPHSASPQLTMRTLAFLSPVNQVPSGSAARAGAIQISASAATKAVTAVVVREIFIPASGILHVCKG